MDSEETFTRFSRDFSITSTTLLCSCKNPLRFSSHPRTCANDYQIQSKSDYIRLVWLNAFGYLFPLPPSSYQDRLSRLLSYPKVCPLRATSSWESLNSLSLACSLRQGWSSLFLQALPLSLIDPSRSAACLHVGSVHPRTLLHASNDRQILTSLRTFSSVPFSRSITCLARSSQDYFDECLIYFVITYTTFT